MGPFNGVLYLGRLIRCAASCCNSNPTSKLYIMGFSSLHLHLNSFSLLHSCSKLKDMTSRTSALVWRSALTYSTSKENSRQRLVDKHRVVRWMGLGEVRGWESVRIRIRGRINSFEIVEKLGDRERLHTGYRVPDTGLEKGEILEKCL